MKIFVKAMLVFVLLLRFRLLGDKMQSQELLSATLKSVLKLTVTGFTFRKTAT
jgi:hypothetical protein